MTNAVGGWPADDAAYRYDRAGNPVRRTELGLGVTNEFNNLNQIEASTVNVSRVTVLGDVNYPMGTVTVGSVQAVLHGTTFEAANVPVAPGSNTLTAIYYGPGFTNVGHIATDTVSVVISNRVYQHDANGNLTNDSVFSYLWDAANQLTNVVRLADAQRVLSMRYDALGRRVEVTRADESIERYVYIPGTFLVLAVLDGDNEIKELYTHGPDLSGTLGGAGGIGGILADFRPQASALRSLHSDAMGNIVLVTDESGAEAARYRYTPFGREIQREGDYEARYRFSSKEFDPETRLVYYGYRYLNPQTGRWLNRDRTGESGGVNLYAWVMNSPQQLFDAHGLTPLWAHWVFINDEDSAVLDNRMRDNIESVPQTCRAAGLADEPERDNRKCAKLAESMVSHAFTSRRALNDFLAERRRLRKYLSLASGVSVAQRRWVGSLDDPSPSAIEDPLLLLISEGEPQRIGLLHDWVSQFRDVQDDGTVIPAYETAKSGADNSLRLARDQLNLLRKQSALYLDCCCKNAAIDGDK